LAEEISSLFPDPVKAAEGKKKRSYIGNKARDAAHRRYHV
jgi:hypothetical protein